MDLLRSPDLWVGLILGYHLGFLLALWDRHRDRRHSR